MNQLKSKTIFRKKKRLVKRPAQPVQAHPTALSKAKIEALIEEKMHEESELLNIGKDGVAFVETCANPLGNQLSNPKMVSTGLPDGNTNVFDMVIRGTFSHSGAVSTSGMIGVDGPCLDMATHPPAWICYGNNPDTKANAPTSLVETTAPSDMVLAASILAALDPALISVTAVGLKVISTGPNEMSGGVFRAYHGLGVPYTSYVPAFVVYGDAIDHELADPYPVAKGIQVRTPFSQLNTGQEGVRAYSYSDQGNGYGFLPRVTFSGLHATATIQITYAIHFRCYVNGDVLPFPIKAPHPEEELPKLMHLVNTMPYVTEGNSFKSFLNWAKRTFRKGKVIFKKGKDVYDNIAPLIKPLIAAL
jgi:hypothetical protein